MAPMRLMELFNCVLEVGPWLNQRGEKWADCRRLNVDLDTG